MEVPITMRHVGILMAKFGMEPHVVTKYNGERKPTVILKDNHFVCAWGNRYFDPYGEPSPYPKHISFPYRVQGEGENTCGRHCVLRLKHRDMGDDEYYAWLKNAGMNMDLFVYLNT